MPSKYWDESRAEKIRALQFEFAENTLRGKTVIVAGGTGGLGAATVALLAREGARLVVGYRANAERARALAHAVHEQFGAQLTFVAGDIADNAVRRTLVEVARSSDAPLAGAAIFPGDPARAAFDSLTAEQMRASLDVNYVGPALLAKEIGAEMESQAEAAGAADGGGIVLLATMQAVGVFPGSMNYAAPKAALAHAARVLAATWRRVRVNVVAPGATIAGMAEASVSGGKYDAFVASGVIPRFGRPEDVACAVRFFLEPDSYVTGQVLVADGGLTIRH